MAGILEEIKYKIKPYILKLINYCGCNEENILMTIMDENQLKEMENHIRKLYIRDKLKNNDVFKTYFGDSIDDFDDIKTFEFNPGARKILLFEIPEAIKKFRRQ
jgi:hypothetical protein